MREIFEFRVPERLASKYLLESDGVAIGTTIRKVETEANTRVFDTIRDVDAKLRAESGGKDFFFLGWDIRRTYDASELREAQLFLVNGLRVFEPAGEQCGTEYDEKSACPLCGAGARLRSNLILDRLPNQDRFGIASTIAGEIVVSQRVAIAFTEACVDAPLLRPVEHRLQRRRVLSDKWLHLADTACRLEVSNATVTGNRPFDTDVDDRYRCLNGDTVGLNVLSEIAVVGSSYLPDIAFTKQFVGVRRGVLRPNRLLLVSPRLLHAIQPARGLGFEIARVAER